jgi:energy-coupling factor transport system ATP-binding protein
VAIAGVIAMHPNIVIMDEPTAMLDPMGRREVMDAAKKLHAEGVTVLLITHFMDEAAQTERIIVMDEGEIVMDDIPSEVFQHSEKLKELDLDVPPMVELSNGLISSGVEFSRTSDIDEMAEGLCQLFLKN